MNIRLNMEADKIETVRRNAKGALVWKKERKPPKKFCTDLALDTVHELNDVYNAEKYLVWRAYWRNRYSENPDPELSKDQPHSLAQRVQNVIADHSQEDVQDDAQEARPFVADLKLEQKNVSFCESAMPRLK